MVVSGMANRPAVGLVMADWQRETLEGVVRCSSKPYRVVQQARGLLLAADGVANSEIAERLGVSRNTVLGWRRRFESQGLKDFGQVRPGRGPKPVISGATIAEVVHKTLHTRPPAETHWSCRSMAKEVGLSKSTVQEIWSARGIKPHLVDTFKLSTDAHFEEKLVDVVGLYLHPPDQAVVLCMDEESQIQALDRTQPSLPMKKGRAGTMTHDYKRHGTTTLFAALNVITGVVMGQCLPRHRHEEFLTFLKTIDRNVPQRTGRPSHPGQLRDPHPSRRRRLAGQAPAVPFSFRANLQLVAEPGRALVSRTDRQTTPPGCLRQRAQSHRRHRRIPGRA